MRKRFLVGGLFVLTALIGYPLGYLYFSQESFIFKSKPLPQNHLYLCKIPFEDHYFQIDEGIDFSLTKYLPVTPATSGDVAK